MGVPSVCRRQAWRCPDGGAQARPLRLQPEGGAFFKGFVSLEDRCSNFWTGALRSRTRNTLVIFFFQGKPSSSIPHHTRTNNIQLQACTLGKRQESATCAEQHGVSTSGAKYGRPAGLEEERNRVVWRSQRSGPRRGCCVALTAGGCQSRERQACVRVPDVHTGSAVWDGYAQPQPQAGCQAHMAQQGAVSAALPGCGQRPLLQDGATCIRVDEGDTQAHRRRKAVRNRDCMHAQTVGPSVSVTPIRICRGRVDAIRRLC